MPHDETPEFIDWDETMSPENSRFFGIIPALAIGTLGFALASGGFYNHYGHNFCYPRSRNGYRDFYSCSPRYVCRPIP